MQSPLSRMICMIDKRLRHPAVASPEGPAPPIITPCPPSPIFRMCLSVQEFCLCHYSQCNNNTLFLMNYNNTLHKENEALSEKLMITRSLHIYKIVGGGGVKKFDRL